MLTRLILSALLAVTVSCSTIPLRLRNDNVTYLAPLQGDNHPHKVDDSYFVFIHENSSIAQHFANIGKDLSTSDGYIGFDTWPAYSAIMDTDFLNNVVRRDASVKLVESNRRIYFTSPDDVSQQNGSSNSNKTMTKRQYMQSTELQAPYGLQMIAGSNKLSTPIKDNEGYDYLTNGGSGVNVYVLDTGIRLTHNNFGGRAVAFQGFDQRSTCKYVPTEDWTDQNGHGTHVAGTVGARRYGVAPGATIVNVKVLDKNRAGFTDKIAKAIEDATADHNDNKKTKENGTKGFRGSVINLSLTYEGSVAPMNTALRRARDAGIALFAAAGNNDKLANNVYPCAHTSVVCIAAIDSSYNKASFSNYGPKVNYLAPGVATESLSHLSDSGTIKMSGTSMACPHAAGTAAIFTSWLGLANGRAPEWTYSNILDGLASGFGSDTKNWLINTGIHSPKKNKNEPFRSAGEWPIKDPQNVVAAGLADASQVTVTSNPTVTAAAQQTTSLSITLTTDAPITDTEVYTSISTDGDAQIVTDDPTASSSPTSTVPPQNKGPVCTGSPTKWVPREPLLSAITTFCDEAEKQGVQDKDSGNIWRQYLSDKDVVTLTIEWPSGNPWKPNKNECAEQLAEIMDTCDADSYGNPMNWKHGGYLTLGVAKYSILPAIDRGYTPGTCSFHLHEEDDFVGADLPGEERTHNFYLRDNMVDGAGKTVGSVPSDVGFGDGNSYTDHSYYAPLTMTPEAQNGDYIQFSIGSLSWTTKDSEGRGRCTVGGWDSSLSPQGRDMDCFLPC